MFRIARAVAPGRVISTVDPEARHGHKTSARGFDGYKGHIAIDPDTEIITATAATAGNSGDADVAEDLLADILPAEPKPKSLFQPSPGSRWRSTGTRPTAPGNYWNGWTTPISTMDSRCSLRRR